jgi:Tol biopolymer transport system component
VFSALRPNVDVWTVPVDANQGEVTGTMRPVTQNVSFDGYPAISADGEKLAFISSRSGNWDVWTRDLKTGKEAPATATPLQELQPVLSRDGSTIFYRTNQNQQTLVHRTNFSGGVPTKLCEGCGTPTDVFKGYLLLEPPGAQAFHIIDLASNRITNLVESTRPNQIPFGGRFSPDGRWIAFHATTERPAEARQIFVAPFRGWPDESGASPGDWIPITDGEEMDRQCYWSPDGNLLYFLSDRDGFRCIWAQPLDAGTKRPDGEAKSVLHFHRGRRSLRGIGRVSAIKLSVARDQLVFALGELTGNIWMKDVQEQL